MKLLVGLGNFGSKYALTRHNLGWMALESWVAKFEPSFRQQTKFKGQFFQGQVIVEGTSLAVGALFPETYMNKSGEAVAACMDVLKIEAKDVIALHDELDLPAMHWRLKVGGGAGGHNGLKSMIQLAGENFTRIRLGIGKPADPRFAIENWVLSRFSDEELAFWRGEEADVHRAIELCLLDKTGQAMNEFNSKQ